MVCWRLLQTMIHTIVMWTLDFLPLFPTFSLSSLSSLHSPVSFVWPVRLLCLVSSVLSCSFEFRLCRGNKINLTLKGLCCSSRASRA